MAVATVKPIIDASCQNNLQITMPEKAMPGQTIDINFEIDTENINQENQLKCNIALLDDSVGIYSQNNQLNTI